jgi:RNA recognition motif-containing protein
MKILVRNLAKATTEEKILTLFKEHGNVQSCNLVLDKETHESKGFAFVEMPKVGEAKAAIKLLNGYKLAGNLLRVKKAETKKEAVQDSPVETTKPKPAAKVKKTNKVTTEKPDDIVKPTNVWGAVKD